MCWYCYWWFLAFATEPILRFWESTLNPESQLQLPNVSKLSLILLLLCTVICYHCCCCCCWWFFCLSSEVFFAQLLLCAVDALLSCSYVLLIVESPNSALEYVLRFWEIKLISDVNISQTQLLNVSKLGLILLWCVDAAVDSS